SQTIERSFPEFAVFLDPFRGLLERLGLQLHFMNAPIALPPKQPRLFQHAQVFRNCGQRHRVGPRQTGDTSVALRQLRQDPPPGRTSRPRPAPNPSIGLPSPLFRPLPLRFVRAPEANIAREISPKTRLHLPCSSAIP